LRAEGYLHPWDGLVLTPKGVACVQDAGIEVRPQCGAPEFSMQEWVEPDPSEVEALRQSAANAMRLLGR
jgi:hypothetical protein